RVRMEALEGARLHADAALRTFVAQVRAPRPGGDRDPRRRLGGEAHRAVAHEGDRPDVALAETVRAHDLETRVEERLARVRDRQLEDVRGAVQPVDVLAQTEDGGAAVVALVAPDALEDAEAVVERVRQHVHLRGFPWDELAVEPDALRLFH